MKELNILGVVQRIYRRAQLSKKKGKDNFWNLVADCLSTDEGEAKGGLTPEMVRKFSRRARHYILAYFYMEHDEENKIDEEGLHELNIERVKKNLKLTGAR